MKFELVCASGDALGKYPEILDYFFVDINSKFNYKGYYITINDIDELNILYKAVDRESLIIDFDEMIICIYNDYIE